LAPLEQQPDDSASTRELVAVWIGLDLLDIDESERRVLQHALQQTLAGQVPSTFKECSGDAIMLIHRISVPLRQFVHLMIR
jgi:hypothetical protein